MHCIRLPVKPIGTLGMDVADAGDVDGDGLSDLLVGATEYDQGPGKVGLF